MADAYETSRYEDAPNFNHRFKVETNMNGEIVDHRDGWAQREYKRGTPGVYEPPEGSELGPIKRGERMKPEKPKPNPVKRATRKTKTKTDDAALDAANTKDLKTKNLKL